MEKTFANEFKPTFRASDLSVFCGDKFKETTRIGFLKKFQPFSGIKINTENNKKSNPILLSPNEKKLILDELNESFSSGNLKFNDDQLIEKVTQVKNGFVKNDIDTITNYLRELNIENEKNDDGFEEYLTAESDEENLLIDKDLSVIKESQAKRYVTTRRGILLEKHILAQINQVESKKFVKNKEKKVVDFGLFKICGIIDGIDVENKTVIEIKTRSRFDMSKKTISNRERVQSLCYMKLFECDRCYFIEAGPDGVYKAEIIEWNEEGFNFILGQLEKFVKDARNLSKEEFEKKLLTFNFK